MSRTFTITISAEERTAALIGLGWLWKAIENSPLGIREPIEELIDKITNTPGTELSAEEQRRMGQQKDDSRMVNAASGAGAARAILAPPAPTDYFAKLRNGDVPMTPPDGAELSTCEIVGTAKTEKYLKVILKNKGQANCFDRDLWQMIENRKGQPVGLWIKPTDDGKYKNVVGVRA
jgi:hypothetical protein